MVFPIFAKFLEQARRNPQVKRTQSQSISQCSSSMISSIYTLFTFLDFLKNNSLSLSLVIYSLASYALKYQAFDNISSFS